jgi:hypothetical protein
MATEKWPSCIWRAQSGSRSALPYWHDLCRYIDVSTWHHGHLSRGLLWHFDGRKLLTNLRFEQLNSLQHKVESFPFNVVDNPMYVGSTLSFLATALWYESPAGLVLTVLVHFVYRIALRYEGYVGLVALLHG